MGGGHTEAASKRIRKHHLKTAGEAVGRGAGGALQADGETGVETPRPDCSRNREGPRGERREQREKEQPAPSGLEARSGRGFCSKSRRKLV